MKSFLKNIFSTIIGIIVAIIIIISLFIGSVALMSSNKEVTVKEKSILKIDLSNLKIVERTSENPLNNFLNSSGDVIENIELKQVLDNIEKAKKDENIKAIYINTSFVNAGLSQIEEVRNKLLEFKETD